MEITKLIRPASIAVVGATERPKTFGCTASLQALKSSVKDRVYLVNPTRDELHGQKVYKDLADLPEIPDCVVVATPRDTILPILEQAARLGAGSAVVYASGFSEEHSEEGDALEARMVEVSKEYSFPILGPNCAGLLNNEDNISLWGLGTDFDMNTRVGGVAVVAQSGYIAQNLINTDYFNISYAVSTGNGNATMLEDFLKYVVDDDRVSVVAVYLEGLKDASKFADALGAAARKKKPVVILKSGKSSKGAKAAASHTGNLAGSSAAYEAAFKKFGAISVDSIEEFISTSQMFSVLKGNFLKPATFAGLNLSGGENTLCADLSEKHGVSLPDFAPETITEIEKYIPAFATASNPLDGTTALFSKLENIVSVIRAAESDPAIGGIIFGANIGEKVTGGPPKTIVDAVLAAIESGCSKPVFLVGSQESSKDQEIRRVVEAAGVPLTSCGETGYTSLGKLTEFMNFDPDSSSLRLAAPDAPLPEGSVALSESESKREMAVYGLPVPTQVVVKDTDELAEVAAKMNFPLVLKIDSPDILHKTDAGGVKLGINSAEEAGVAYGEILASCKAYAPDARVNGILVQEMAPKATEIIIGVSNDAQFGPMLLAGLGGVFVEVFKDVSLCPCPVTKAEAIGMLKNLKAYKLLAGYRGSAPADIDALADLMVAVSDYAAEHRNELKELDLNPVFVYDEGKGVKVVDALVVKAGIGGKE
ncbi:MAG: acetate--CoA ligase family protein [Clostridiales Family XIII bacterium]|jgi:acyl-CoA synthetase (NDP forming)|nr:acetate--CoA ligase family protein [Clostridiales Family XIII bacterium]